MVKVTHFFNEIFSDGLINHPILKPFLNLIENSKNVRVEVSKKIVNNSVHPSRLYFLFFQDSIPSLKEIYQKCLRLLFGINFLKGISLNIAEILSILQDANMQNLRILAVGLDLDKDFRKSRIKLFFEFVRSPDLLYSIIKEYKYHSTILNLIMSGEFIVAFNFYLDHRCTLKLHLLYDNFHNNALLQRKMERFFNHEIIETMKICDFFTVAFKEQELRTQLYFYFHDMNVVIKNLNIKNIPEAFLSFYDYPLSGVCVYADELTTGRLSEYNVYYALGNRISLSNYE